MVGTQVLVRNFTRKPLERKLVSGYCKVQPRRASLDYPFCNTAAHMEATPTREGI